MASVKANLKNLAFLQVDASAQHENIEWKQDSPSEENKANDEDTLSSDEEDENDDSQGECSSSDTDEDNQTDEGRSILESNTSFAVFWYNDSQCIKWYRSIDRCEDHIASGKHVYPQTKLSLLDTAMKTYKAQTDKIVPKAALVLPIPTASLRSMNNSTCMAEGCALPQPQSNRCFSKEQIAFLVEKYNEGERSGHKWNPVAVVSVVKTLKVGGHLRFSPEDHLTTAQIKSYFSRLTNSRRQQSQLDANVMPDNVANNQRMDDSALDDDDVEHEEIDDDFELALTSPNVNNFDWKSVTYSAQIAYGTNQ